MDNVPKQFWAGFGDKKDLPQLRTIEQQKIDMPEFFEGKIPFWSERDFTDHFHARNSYTYVAKPDPTGYSNNIAGFLTCEKDDPEEGTKQTIFQINNFGIDKAYNFEDVGAALLNKLKSFPPARSGTTKTIIFDVNEYDLPLQYLLQKQGFKPARIIKSREHSDSATAPDLHHFIYTEKEVSKARQ